MNFQNTIFVIAAAYAGFTMAGNCVQDSDCVVPESGPIPCINGFCDPVGAVLPGI